MSSYSAATAFQLVEGGTAVSHLSSHNKFLDVENRDASTALRPEPISQSQFLLPSSRIPMRHRAPQMDMNVRFVSLEDWEGIVQEVSADRTTFRSGLINLLSRESIDTDEAVFSLDDVQPFQRDLVQPGAFFQWSVGWRFIGRSREKSSRLNFRRLPAWTRAELQGLDKRAADFVDFISAPQV